MPQTSLLVNILIFYGILIAVNLPAPILGLEFENGEKNKLWFAPPGWVIPVVWFLLFTLLGITRYELQKTQAEPKILWWLYGLAILCATYAYYTIGLAKITGISPLWFGLFGNALVILYSIIVCLKFYPVSNFASWMVFPVPIWTTYATLIIAGEMRKEALI